MLCVCGCADEDHVVHNDSAGYEHDSRYRCACWRPCFKCRCLNFELAPIQEVSAINK